MGSWRGSSNGARPGTGRGWEVGGGGREVRSNFANKIEECLGLSCEACPHHCLPLLLLIDMLDKSCLEDAFSLVCHGRLEGGPTL